MTAAEALPDPVTRGQEILADLELSGADPSELNQQQLPILRAMFEDDSGSGLWLFAKHVCGCKDLTTHLHWQECVFLSRWGYIKLDDGRWEERYPLDGETATDSWRRLMMCVPRDTFKTTLGTRSLVLWKATKNPEYTFGIFNEAQDNVKKWLSAMRQILESSKLYHVLWPERLPTGVHFQDTRNRSRSWPWGDSGFLLVRESMNVSELTFEPFGIGGAHTGKHFTHKVYDDIIGEKSAESEAIMGDAVHFVDHGRAIERPSDNGCELINFTRWAYSDVYQHILNKWPNDYKVYHRALLENPDTGEPDVVKGTSIFPERFPTDLCKKMYADDAFTFMSQRQCIPQAGRETSFQVDWVRYFHMETSGGGEPCIRILPKYYDPTAMDSHLLEDSDGEEIAPNLVPLYQCDKALLLDPAPSKKAERSAEPRARNALVMLAMDPWGRIFTLQALPLREDPVTVMQAIVQMCVYWHCRKVGVESVNFSAVYAPLWSRILKHEHPQLDLSWIPLEPKGEDKDTRIRRLVAPHKQGLWYYNQDADPDPGTDYAIQELLEYPHGSTRDLIDAAAYWGKTLSRHHTPDEVDRIAYTAAYEETERNPHTHY